MPSFSSVLTTLLAISASALAFTTPTTFNQTSNPVFTPNSGAIVPVGKPFQITWGPTESGTVSIILLRGPANNILPLYPIVEKIPNSGSYTWTPKTDLENDTTHYGIQIIIDANGQFQYSTQFGISNPNPQPSSTTTSAATTSVATTSAAASSTSSGYGTGSVTTSYETVMSTTKSYITSLITVTTPSPSVNTTTYVAPTYTYTPPSNSTVTYAPSGTLAPTKSSAIPPIPTQTGAAASLNVASGLLLGIAGVVAMLL